MARRAQPSPEQRWCTSCGRVIEWRAKWARNWDNIKWCSDACRRRGISAIDRELEHAILELLNSSPTGATVCPSEAARLIAGEHWEAALEPARRAARRLVVTGHVEIIQRGQVADPSTARGSIRIRSCLSLQHPLLDS
jgi:hypothetical protein